MHDEEKLPIKFGPVSNGEFIPAPQSPLVKETIRRTHELARENARRLGVSRRAFLTRSTGAAATLFVLNACSQEQAESNGEEPGGSFDVSKESTIDNEAAMEEFGGDEFIFDVQTHYIDYDPNTTPPELSQLGFPQADCPEAVTKGDPRYCFSAESYMRELFVRSDTSLAILSALPAVSVGVDSGNREGEIAVEIAQQLGCADQVLLHGGAYPHVGALQGAFDAMTRAVETHNIVGWKIYTMVPDDSAFYFDDHDPSRPQIGQAFIDHVRDIGPPILCTHRGMSGIVRSDKELTSPADIGPAAVRNSDISFVVYHSGFEPNSDPEGPYDPTTDSPQGIDRLIRSVLDAGLEPNQNVYAELGGTWFLVLKDPTQAAHVLGKLLKYIGEDRVVWGTDSIWFGTPQDQIQALRTFKISEELQETHGYPALTPEIKAKIFGLNSAKLYDVEPVTKCEIDASQVEAIRSALPIAHTYGPQTAAEAHALIRGHQTQFDI